MRKFLLNQSGKTGYRLQFYKGVTTHPIREFHRLGAFESVLQEVLLLVKLDKGYYQVLFFPQNLQR